MSHESEARKCCHLPLNHYLHSTAECRSSTVIAGHFGLLSFLLSEIFMNLSFWLVCVMIAVYGHVILPHLLLPYV